LRIVFIGRRNFMNHCFANWLAARHEVVGYFPADVARRSLQNHLRWLRRRLRRVGIFRTVDQVLYQVHYRLFQEPTDRVLMREAFASYFGYKAFALAPSIPVYEFPDLNGPDAMRTLDELKPDLAFAICISQYLRKPYEDVPRLGTVLYHEGLTPEYKGVHTAFWANARGECDRIGYTLLRLTEDIDAGEPVAQGTGQIDPELAKWNGYAGHQALIDGLPDVERGLAALERGEPVEINRTPGPAQVFSYAGLTDEIRRVWWLLRRRAKARKGLRGA
jgi:methionyl-tRNA formyltransferase